MRQVTNIASHATIQLQSRPFLITDQVIVFSPSGSAFQARVLLDTGFKASFLSEHLVVSLNIPGAH